MKASFTSLATYAACPLKYDYLQVEHLEEPLVPPDWRHAPAGLPLVLASEFDRMLGLAVHAALARWQRTVDGGAAPSGDALVGAVRQEARARRLNPGQLARVLATLAPGVQEYARGPWPRRSTLFLEQTVQHRLDLGDGTFLELALRVDRVVRFRKGVAILDFKTVPPHVFQMRIDEWQLRTYAIAAPDLLGTSPGDVSLFLIDLRDGRELEIGASARDLEDATRELLTCARGIVRGDFEVSGHEDRPCWSCGFRLACPSSLATEAPSVPPGPSTSPG